jgi:hypothetical protein
MVMLGLYALLPLPSNARAARLYDPPQMPLVSQL